MQASSLIKVMAAVLASLYSIGVWAEEAPREAPEDVPALMNYLEHHMLAVNRSLIWDDLSGLHAAARAIAHHPMLPMGERVKVLSQLGSDATAFRAHDAQMQEVAQGLADAALQGDRREIEKLHWQLIERCAECHRDFGHRFGRE